MSDRCTCVPDNEMFIVTAEARRPAETNDGIYLVYPEDLYNAALLDVAVICESCGAGRPLSREEWEMV